MTRTALEKMSTRAGVGGGRGVAGKVSCGFGAHAPESVILHGSNRD